MGELADDSKRAFLYKGTHLMMDAPVAIKLLKIPSQFATEPFLKRFRHESRLHYGLAQASPHVVRLLAGGTVLSPATGSIVPFSVLEWLHGRTLASDFAERRAHWGKGRKIDEAITLLDPAVSALAAAHARAVVHREVTPANLFLADVDGTATLKVLDFGLAKVMTETQADPGRARTVDMGPLAAPIYAAPEQFSREVGDVGPATDLYSLMMIFLEALRDRAVMEDSSSPLAVRVLDRTKRPTPRSLGIDVGDIVELVCTPAVALRPADRPKDIGVFWDDLKRAALKDARSVSISAPPNLRDRADRPPPSSNDPTAVAINLSFARISQAPTVPHPEPTTLSQPPAMDGDEPLSSTGELFALKIPPTMRSDLPPAPPKGRPVQEVTIAAPPTPRMPDAPMPPTEPATPISAAPEPPKPKPIAPTLVSPQIPAPPNVPSGMGLPIQQRVSVVESSAMPFELGARAPSVQTNIVPLVAPSNAPPAAPEWISAPRPPSVRAPKANMPWLAMIIAFFVVGAGLTIVAMLLLGDR
ncbi:MAG TPA: protein kinase [Polyangiaceae bacterium]